MRRRNFITLVSGVAAGLPFAARAEQHAMPIVGYLSTRSLDDSANIVAAFRRGLNETGYTEGQSVMIEWRFAEGHYDRLPALAADLVRRQVNILVATGGTGSAVAAKPLLPATMPMVFAMGGDPVKLGIVPDLARPRGNATGITFLVNALTAKQLQLLQELAPKAKVIGFLVNPNDPNLPSQINQAREATTALDHKLVIANATTERDLESAFATLSQERVEALFVQVDPFFTDRRGDIAALAARYSLPAIYALREFADAGGLMSYGTSITDANRQLGVYAGQVLKGKKPADLPVTQSTKFELVINLKTAKALGLTISNQMQLLADEVIE